MLYERWRWALHLHGLLPFDVAGNALDVFLRRFLHVVPTIFP